MWMLCWRYCLPASGISHSLACRWRPSLDFILRAPCSRGYRFFKSSVRWSYCVHPPRRHLFWSPLLRSIEKWTLDIEARTLLACSERPQLFHFKRNQFPNLLYSHGWPCSTWLRNCWENYILWCDGKHHEEDWCYLLKERGGRLNSSRVVCLFDWINLVARYFI